MVQMIELNRGLTVLPGWLADEYCQKLPVKTIRLGKKGLARTLFTGMRESDEDISYMQAFVQLGKQRKGES
jgi:LysR family transcriptional regulator for metE and metH